MLNENKLKWAESCFLPAAMISIKQCRAASSSVLGLLVQYSSRKIEQWDFSRHFQCDKAVLPVYFMVDVAYIRCKHLALSLMAACCKCILENWGWVWRMMTPLSAGRCFDVSWWVVITWWFDTRLPHLMDGLLSETGAERYVSFFPQSLYVYGTHFQSSLARSKQSQEESKSMYYLLLLLLGADLWLPEECFFQLFEFFLSRLEGVMFIQHGKIQCSWIWSEDYCENCMNFTDQTV